MTKRLFHIGDRVCYLPATRDGLTIAGTVTVNQQPTNSFVRFEKDDPRPSSDRDFLADQNDLELLQAAE
jgi:hypothetical protein